MIQKAYTETSMGQCHYRFSEGEGTPIVFLHQTPSLVFDEEKQSAFLRLH